MFLREPLDLSRWCRQNPYAARRVGGCTHRYLQPHPHSFRDHASEAAHHLWTLFAGLWSQKQYFITTRGLYSDWLSWSLSPKTLLHPGTFPKEHRWALHHFSSTAGSSSKLPKKPVPKTSWNKTHITAAGGSPRNMIDVLLSGTV